LVLDARTYGDDGKVRGQINTILVAKDARLAVWRHYVDFERELGRILV